MLLLDGIAVLVPEGPVVLSKRESQRSQRAGDLTVTTTGYNRRWRFVITRSQP
jgi:hypothetical protein